MEMVSPYPHAVLWPLNASFPALSLHCRAVKEAASAADCVLATYQQLCAPGFPLEVFSCSVEFAPQAVLDLEAAKAAAALLGGQQELRYQRFLLFSSTIQ